MIARSKEKQKKNSELTNPIVEIQVRRLPLGNKQRLFPLFLTSSKAVNSASTCLAQVEFTKQKAANVAITLQLICTCTERQSQLPRVWLR